MRKRVKGVVSPTLIVAAVVGAIMLSMGIALKVQTSRLAAEKKEHAAVVAAFAGFKAETARLGREAETAKREAEQKAAKDKEATDARAKTLAAERDVARRQLRDRSSGPRSSLLPQAGPATGGADQTAITYDRGRLDQALRDFDSGAQRLVGEGAEAVDDIDLAREWATKRRSQ